jgi:hypothetical protein
VEQKKAASVYTPDELGRIYDQMLPKGLLLPVIQKGEPSPSVGPKVMVYRLHSELGLDPEEPELAYWDALGRADVTDAIVQMSLINGNLSEARATNLQIHLDLAGRFVEPEIQALITIKKLEEGAASVIFNRIGCLLAVRHLMLFGGFNSQDWNAYKVGRLALLANDFVQNIPTPPTPIPSSLDILLIVAPTWDINNPANLGHAMSRMLTILTEILPRSDPTVAKLVSRLGITPNEIEIDGLPLYKFASVVFGLFAYARSRQAEVRVLFNPNEIFQQTGLLQGVLNNLLDARALTLDEFRSILSKGTAVSQATFLEELRGRPFLIDSLNIFRKYPLLRLDSERILVLDVQFVVELLTSGVYWSIHDALPSKKRQTFKELWGRMFELFTVDLLAKFYPPLSCMLTPDVNHSKGQIDALIDFGDYVLVFEIKSSLLTEPAKRSADKESLRSDIHRKFVENELGNPKAIKQLSAACLATLTGEVKTAKKGDAPIVYPILVSDEPVIEATFMNAFLNEEFQKEGIGDARVKPLTVMSLRELENTLPYVAGNDFSWNELLDSRFNEFGVYPNSVGQAVYALIVTKRVKVKQNLTLKRKYDEFGERMREVFQELQSKG